MKIGAVAILTTMILGLASWGGTQIVNNSTNIAKIDAIQQTHYQVHNDKLELLLDMQKEQRADIKKLLQR